MKCLIPVAQKAHVRSSLIGHATGTPTRATPAADLGGRRFKVATCNLEPGLAAQTRGDVDDRNITSAGNLAPLHCPSRHARLREAVREVLS